MIIEIRDEVVALSGVLRRNHWRTLESAVNLRLRHHPAGIVVDCGGLIALTPEGAETFRDAAAHVAQAGASQQQQQSARMVVANVPPDVMRVLRGIPNLGSQLPIATSVEDARASLGLARTPARASGTGRDGTRAATPPGVVVAGLLGTSADPHAVAVACRLAQNHGSVVHLAYLLVVPRHMPLLSALGEEETRARQTLDSLEGGVRAAGLIPVSRVERTRDPASRLVEVAAETNAEAITLALPPAPDGDLLAVTDATLARARCDVLVNRLPGATALAAAEAGAPERRER